LHFAGLRAEDGMGAEGRSGLQERKIRSESADFGVGTRQLGAVQQRGKRRVQAHDYTRRVRNNSACLNYFSGVLSQMADAFKIPFPKLRKPAASGQHRSSGTSSRSE